MKTLIQILFILAVGGYVVHDWMFTEVTIYKMFCTKGRIDGVCKSEEQTANPTTYKVFVQQQMVIYWIGTSSPVRYPFCAVRDARNWSCKYETGNVVPEHEYIMNDGDFWETGFGPSGAPELFYTVSAWDWWRVWLSQKLK